MRRGQQYWSKVGRHLLSRTVFLHHSLEIKPNYRSVSSVWRPLNRGDNNEKALVGTTKMWLRSLNRGLISPSILQLFRDFDYWPLNGGWPLNRWLLNGGYTQHVRHAFFLFPLIQLSFLNPPSELCNLAKLVSVSGQGSGCFPSRVRIF